MRTVVAVLAGNTVLAMAAALTAFLLLFAVLHLYARSGRAHAESTRKLLHTGSGILTLAFPFIFRDAWPVFALTGASAAVIAIVKFVPAVRVRFGGVTNRVGRTTLGELYFPVSVALLFWLTHDEHPLLFVIPVLMLTFADATCALVGRRYGLTRYHGASKSLEGSVAFVVVAFFCVHVPLLVWTEVGRVESLLTAMTLALLVMILEGSAWRGLDNLFIPIGGYFLLRAYLAMDAATLGARLLITIALVALVVVARRRTTLEDDSLAAGAFLCYVAWAIMGWPWLVGPLVILLGYRWLSRPTPDNSRRMHGVPAVLSVWAAAVGWLALGSWSGDRTLLFPYMVVFAAHLAMFGISRLAHQYHGIAIAPLFVRALLTSTAIVLLPYALLAGVALATAVHVGAALAAITMGMMVFILTQPDIRAAEQTPRRWVAQASAAGFASVVAWGIASLV